MMLVRPASAPRSAAQDPRLGLRVHRAQRVVEHEDRRVLRQRPRDRAPLLLPAGEIDASLAQHRVVAVRQRGQRLGQLRHLGHSLEPAVVGRAEQHVLAERLAEEEGLLRHEPDRAAQVGEGQPADVDAVDAARRPGRGRRPGPADPPAWTCPTPVAPTTASERPASTRNEIVLQHPAPLARAGIAEPDIRELDRAPAPRRAERRPARRAR